MSRLQLIEARLAVEPYTTRLAVLHAHGAISTTWRWCGPNAEGCVTNKDEFWSGTASSISCPHPRATRCLINVYRQINHVRLRAQWDAMKEKILTPEVIIDYNRQHRAIYNALNERDPPKALRRSITEHLEKARDDLVRATARSHSACIGRPGSAAKVRRSYMRVGQRALSETPIGVGSASAMMAAQRSSAPGQSEAFLTSMARTCPPSCLPRIRRPAASFC